MSLLISDNPIVTTYPRYNVNITFERDAIYDWLKQHTKLVGISYGMDVNLKMVHRVYAKLKPEIELAFIIKFGATRYDKNQVLNAMKKVYSVDPWN